VTNFIAGKGEEFRSSEERRGVIGRGKHRPGRSNLTTLAACPPVNTSGSKNLFHRPHMTEEAKGLNKRTQDAGLQWKWGTERGSLHDGQCFMTPLNSYNKDWFMNYSKCLFSATWVTVCREETERESYNVAMLRVTPLDTIMHSNNKIVQPIVLIDTLLMSSQHQLPCTYSGW